MSRGPDQTLHAAADALMLDAAPALRAWNQGDRK